MMIRIPKTDPQRTLRATLEEVRARVRDDRLKLPLAAIGVTPEQIKAVRESFSTTYRATEMRDRFQFNVTQEK